MMENQNVIGVPTEALSSEIENPEQAENLVTCGQCEAHATEDDLCDECKLCPECCDCWTCAGCDNRFAQDGETRSCSNCEYCDSCCECSYCEGCLERVSQYSSFCGDCERYGDCCRCSQSRANVGFFTSPLTFHKAKLTDYTSNTSRRFISCEIEVADSESGNETSAIVEHWKGSIVEDGSLPDTGFEINTAPAQGDRFIEQIEDICRALANDGAQVSGACGLHVHIDARDFTYYDIRRLVFLYEKIETALFGMIPPSRRNSNYCVPCASLYASSIRANKFPKESKDNLIRTIYGEKQRPQRTFKNHHARYHALNLHSWFYRGTVECRLHSGTTNPSKIIAWGKLWASIMDASMRLTEREIEALTGSSLEILYDLAPDTETRDYITARTTKWNQ